jgi:hypothetical protein
MAGGGPIVTIFTTIRLRGNNEQVSDITTSFDVKSVSPDKEV